MATVEKVVSASGVLARFNHAGVLLAPDVHVSQTLGRLCKETDEQVLLAAALTSPIRSVTRCALVTTSRT